MLGRGGEVLPYYTSPYAQRNRLEGQGTIEQTSLGATGDMAPEVEHEEVNGNGLLSSDTWQKVYGRRSRCVGERLEAVLGSFVGLEELGSRVISMGTYDLPCRAPER